MTERPAAPADIPNGVQNGKSQNILVPSKPAFRNVPWGNNTTEAKHLLEAPTSAALSTVAKTSSEAGNSNTKRNQEVIVKMRGRLGG